MRQLINNESWNQRGKVFEQSNGHTELRQREDKKHQNEQSSYQESSPSFVTDQQMQEGWYLGDSFTLLTSEQSSVSQFCSPAHVNLHSQRCQMFQRQNNPIKNVNDSEPQYFPTLQSYDSFNPSIELLSLESSAQFSQKESKKINLQTIHPNKQFMPEIKSLVEQINLLESDLFNMAKEYLKMKTFCSTVIVSVRTLISQDVGKQLETYMHSQFNHCEFQSIDCQYLEDTNSKKLHSQFSKDLLSKLNSQSLSYSLGQQSREMSKSIQEIFTLGSSKFKLQNNNDSISQNNNDSISKSNQMNGKSTQKKAVHNFKKNQKSDKDKENIYDQMKLTQKYSQNKSAKKPSSRYSKISLKYSDMSMENMKNESMKFLTENNTNRTNSTTVQTPGNIQNNSTAQRSTMATQLLCQVCRECFKPNQFYKHVRNCSNSHQKQMTSLQQTSKLAFNYTLMMDKLFEMRQEIESQIELLTISQQKSNEKAQRQGLIRKLQWDLQKVSKIIEEKQREMEIHLSKNIGFEYGYEKDSMPLQLKSRKQHR